MKKVKTYKGFVIAEDAPGHYQMFTKEEWSYGEGCRYPEFDDLGSLQEAMDQADNY